MTAKILTACLLGLGTAQFAQAELVASYTFETGTYTGQSGTGTNFNNDSTSYNDVASSGLGAASTLNTAIGGLHHTTELSATSIAVGSGGSGQALMLLTSQVSGAGGDGAGGLTPASNGEGATFSFIAGVGSINLTDVTFDWGLHSNGSTASGAFVGDLQAYYRIDGGAYTAFGSEQSLSQSGAGFTGLNTTSLTLNQTLSNGQELDVFLSMASNYSHNNQQIVLDSVQLNSGAIPEPTSLALLSLGGLMLVRRRRAGQA